MIYVSQPFLPEKDKLLKLLSEVLESKWLTNNGPKVRQLESMLSDFLRVPYVLFTSNGTVSLQIAIEACGLSGEIITTPFSYVATANAIIWQKCSPVFADIEEGSFNICPGKIESLITSKTTGILATHVYGLPCKVQEIEQIAKKYNLCTIYDAAHAFGVLLHGKPIASFGDVSSFSFHATKVFHTVEGGAIATSNKQLMDKMFLMRSFGHIYDDYKIAGINGKNSEVHAIFGICNLPYWDQNLEHRKKLFELYQESLKSAQVKLLSIPAHVSWNYGYFPIIFESANELEICKKALESQEIYPRRYFYPSIHTMPFIKTRGHCPNSESLSERVLCLPLHNGLRMEDVSVISDIVLNR